jgi:hypothetical protein
MLGVSRLSGLGRVNFGPKPWSRRQRNNSIYGSSCASFGKRKESFIEYVWMWSQFLCVHCTYQCNRQVYIHQPLLEMRNTNDLSHTHFSEYLWSFVGRKAEATVNLLPLGCGEGVGWGGLRGGGGGGGGRLWGGQTVTPKKYPRASKFSPQLSHNFHKSGLEERDILYKEFLSIFIGRGNFTLRFSYCRMKLFMRQWSNSSFTILIYGSSVFPKYFYGCA